MKKLIAIILVTCLIFSGCTTLSDEDSNKNSAASTSQDPTSTTMPTTTQTVANYDNIEKMFDVEEFKMVDGSTVTIPLSNALIRATAKASDKEVTENVQHQTTHNAYVNLIQKAADIVFVTYPSEEEFALAEENGVVLEITPVVLDAFVFIVNKNNKVDTLTKEQIVDIYSGKITNWNEVGGEDMEIIAYQRPDNSGSQSGIAKWVMGDTELMKAPSEMKPQGMGDLVDSISEYDNSDRAIGYSYYYYTTDMYVRDNIKLLAVNGVTPTPSSISGNSYAYTVPYYAVMRKGDSGKDTFGYKLIDFLLSNKGQKIAESERYVAINSK